jgi:hypothetical protein
MEKGYTPIELKTNWELSVIRYWLMVYKELDLF